jgi:hypothetical protein
MAGEILIPLIVFGAIFGVVYVWVSARNRERMAMIDKGVDPKDFITKTKISMYAVIKWAMLLIGVGLGLFIGSLLEAYTAIDEEPAYIGSALFFGGIGLAVAFFIQRNTELKK